MLGAGSHGAHSNKTKENEKINNNIEGAERFRKCNLACSALRHLQQPLPHSGFPLPVGGASRAKLGRDDAAGRRHDTKGSAKPESSAFFPPGSRLAFRVERRRPAFD